MDKEKTETIVKVVDEESSDEEIEVKPPKPKKERTEAQKQAFLKANETRKANLLKRQEEKEEVEKIRKKELESKIVKKAIQIKKKQIKETKIIEPESDSDDENAPSNYDTPIIREKRVVKPPVIKKPENRIIFL